MSFLTSSFAHAEIERNVERNQRPVVEQVSINEVQAPEILDSPSQAQAPKFEQAQQSDPAEIESDQATEDEALAPAVAPSASSSSNADAESDASKTIELKPEVSTNQGSLLYSFPINAPQGRNGLTPNISLTYNSSDTNTNNILSKGWSFNIPNITRKNKTGTNNLYTDDNFVSSFDGELVHQGGTKYVPRTENGSFIKYELVNNVWQLTDKSGVKYILGADTLSRQDNPSDSTQIYTWMLSQQVNPNGDRISYSYSKDQGQIYPDVISYNSDELFQIQFQKTQKQTQTTSYKSAFKVVTAFEINAISTAFQGDLLRHYELVTENNTLVSIKEKAFKDGQDFEKPEVVFDYENTGSGYNLNTNFTLPLDQNNNVIGIKSVGSNSNYATFNIDVNGDGLSDIVRYRRGEANGYHYYQYGKSKYGNNFYINTGSGFIESSDYTFPEKYNGDVVEFHFNDSSEHEFGSLFQDVNGDGLPDLIRWKRYAYNNSPINSDEGNNIFINTGSGFQLDTSFELPTLSNNRVISLEGRRTLIGDFNGDGLLDFLKHFTGYPSGYMVGYDDMNVLYENTGSGYNLNTNFTLPLDQNNNVIGIKSVGSNSNYATFNIDVNGDGLSDIVRYRRGEANGYHYYQYGKSKYGNNFYINTGSGFIESSDYTFPEKYNGDVVEFHFNDSSEHEFGSLFQDVNGDGLPDLIRWKRYAYNNSPINSDEGNNIFINTGSGFQLDTSFELPTLSNNRVISLEGRRTLIGDFNGDGLLDFLKHFTGYPSGYMVGYDDMNVLYENENESSLLTGIEAQDFETDFTYTHARIQDQSNKVPFPVQVLESMTQSDGLGNTTETTYEYKGADYYYRNPHDKKFAGFAEVIETKANGSRVITKYHQGNGEQGNEPADSYFTLGKVYETSVYDDNNNLYTRSRNNYNVVPNGSGSRFTQNKSNTTQIFDGNSNSVDTAESFEYSSYGNISKHVQHGIVDSNADGSFSDIGNDKRTQYLTYFNNPVNYIVGLPDNETLKDNSNNKVSERQHSYNQTGNRIKTSSWISGSDYSTEKFEYNQIGQVIKQIDPLGNVTNIEYDQYHMYPSLVSNSLGHTTQYEYDTAFGKVISTTTENGTQSTNEYDAFGRLIETKQTVADAGVETLQSYQYDDFDFPRVVAQRVHNGVSEDLITHTFIDGLGRTIQTKTGTEGDYRVIDSVYNNQGELERTSLPYHSEDGHFDGFNADSSLYTKFTYDALARVTETENVKGSTQTSYDGFTTEIKDTLGNKKDLITDAFSNLVQVNEYDNDSVYKTFYEYNPLSLLTKITDAEDNIRNISYDGLGRRTKLEDLHKQGDSSFGIWDYTYNDRDLISETNPNGSTTSFTYDELGRILKEDNDSLSGIEKTLSYDSCSFGIGKLCSVQTNDIAKNLSYYKDGKLKTESKTIDSQNFSFNYSYDKQGRLLATTYPNGDNVNYSYSPYSEATSLAHNGNQIANAEYGVHGKATKVNYQNGSQTQYHFDENNLYELKKKISLSNGNELQNISYDYDNVGNILKIERTADNDTKHTQVYSYDDLYRLKETRMYDYAGNDESYSRLYEYSPIGNIMMMSDGTNPINTYVYANAQSNANPHALASLNGQNYSYDNSGNLTSDSTWNHSWNYDNTLRTSTNGGSNSSYSYDESKQRIKLVENGITTLYPSSDYESESGSIKLSLNLGDSYVASVVDGTLEYVYTDHLGGTEITTDQSGAPTKSFVYYPFGDTHTETGNSDESKQYTGYTKDEATDLQYAGARYYKGDVGRFISQDPVGLALGDTNKMKEISKIEPKKYLGDPQSHNVYSYARNNPVRYIDENGEWFKEYATGQQSFNDFTLEIGQAAAQLSDDSQAYDFAISNPGVAGPIVGITAGAFAAPALASGAATLSVLSADAATGIGLKYAFAKGLEGAVLVHSGGQVLPEVGNLFESFGDFQDNEQGSSVDLLKNTAAVFVPELLSRKASTIFDLNESINTAADALLGNLSDSGESDKKIQKQKTNNKVKNNEK